MLDLDSPQKEAGFVSHPNLKIADNIILSALPAEDRRRLEAQSKVISSKLGEVLYETGEAIRYVYFAKAATVVSLVKSFEYGQSVEVGLIGSEGVAGLEAVLGDGIAQNRAVIQAPNECLP